jgi:hypothetical protein
MIGGDHALVSAMMPTVAELPDDVDTLKAMVLATVEQRAAMEAENSRTASEIV